MAKQEFDQILDECLRLLHARQATIGDCLAKYPEHAAKLAYLLETALNLASAPEVRPSASFRRATRERLLRLTRRRVWWAGLSPAALWPSAGLRGTLATTGIVMLVLLTLTVGTVSAAGESLPGSPLYVVKRGAEQVHLLITTDPEGQARLHFVLAERRLSEAVALSEAGRPDLADQATADYDSELTATLAVVSSEAIQDSSALVEDITQRLSKHQEKLQAAETRVAPPARGAIQRASNSSRHALDRLEKAPKPGKKSR